MAVGECACRRGAANREVDVGHRAGDPGVVEHRRQVQKLTVERDPVKGADGCAPRVGTTGMVEECRCQEVLRGDLGISCERRVGRHQARRIDGTPTSRVHSEHHRETAGKNASSARSRGRASVRHSRAVSTPPVRSVHPMDPIGSVGRGWLMGASQFGGVAARWRRQRRWMPVARPRSLRGRCDGLGARLVTGPSTSTRRCRDALARRRGASAVRAGIAGHVVPVDPEPVERDERHRDRRGDRREG